MPHRLNLAALAALATLSLAGAASSASVQSMYTSDEVISAPVSFADLDISHEAGAKVLVSRVRNAAMGICGPESGDGLDEQARYGKCVNEIVQRAVAKLNNPLVTAMADPNHRRSQTNLAANVR